MASNQNPEILSSRLRGKFLAWSFAIVGSMSTSAVVCLPNTAWAQDDTATADSDAEATQQAEVITRAKFNELMRANKVAELAERMDASLALEPDNPNLLQMNMTLGMMQTRTQPEAALARLKSVTASILEMEELSPPLVGSLSSAARYVTMLDKEMSSADKLAFFDTIITKIKEVGGPVDAMVQGKASLLIAEERADEAKDMLDGIADELREATQSGDFADTSKFVSFATTYYRTLSPQFADASEGILTEAETLINNALDSEEVPPGAVMQLMSLTMAKVAPMVYSDPKQASNLLDAFDEKLKKIAALESKALEREMESAARSLSSTRSRLESALEREAMIGAPAPAFDAEAFVAMEEVSLDDLKGKVVLLDFWAVWCGPCIATFPHLIEWQNEYSDKGLVIIGATRQYGYEWDEEAGKAKRGEDVDLETELAMLEKFRESYDLKHGFMVSPKQSDFSKQYKVSGIPQAVLIDKEGKIAMIRVGSGEANAEALHAKIEELLAN